MKTMYGGSGNNRGEWRRTISSGVMLFDVVLCMFYVVLCIGQENDGRVDICMYDGLTIK